MWKTAVNGQFEKIERTKLSNSISQIFKTDFKKLVKTHKKLLLDPVTSPLNIDPETKHSNEDSAPLYLAG
jgi:hypothetical protein